MMIKFLCFIETGVVQFTLSIYLFISFLGGENWPILVLIQSYENWIDFFILFFKFSFWAGENQSGYQDLYFFHTQLVPKCNNSHKNAITIVFHVQFS
jgi:hypothetical protein